MIECIQRLIYKKYSTAKHVDPIAIYKRFYGTLTLKTTLKSNIDRILQKE